MTKLPLLTALALLAGLSCWTGTAMADEPASEWDKQIEAIKKPVDWFEWGADARLREVWTDNIISHDKSAANQEWHYQRNRFRVWGKITPIENVEVNARLMWEWRNWCKRDTTRAGRSKGFRSFEGDEVLFDKLNVVWKKAFGLEFLDAKVGRQDIILGNGWLVLDGTPLDGSTTIHFDAARLTWTFDEIKTTVDTIWVQNYANRDQYIEPFNDQEGLWEEQDNYGLIVYGKNKSIENVQIDGYYIYKHQNAVAANGEDASINTVGVRVAGTCGEAWEYRAEFAQQFGKKEQATLCAQGFNGLLTYKLQDDWKTRFSLGYEFLSGDNPGTKKNEAFDLLWGRWPQFHEGYIYAQAFETRIADVTNLHRIGLGAACTPHEMITLSVNYHLLFAHHNSLQYARPANFSDDSNFRGQAVTTSLKYKINKHISGHVQADFFFPGDYYTDQNNDPSIFLRAQVVFSF